jgi:hypothetical protein
MLPTRRLMGLKLEGVLGMASALAAIAGLILLAPGPDRAGEDDSTRPGWLVGLTLIGLAFFWFGVAGILD